MNLCIDARPLQNGHCTRGVGILVANLLREMASILPEQEVTLVTQQGAVPTPIFAHERRLQTFRLERPNRFNWLADHLLLSGRLRSSGVDLFLATDLNSYLASAPGLKVVAMAYDLIPFLFPEVMASQPLPVRLGWRINFGKLKHAAALIAISQATKNDLIRLFGIPAERIRVIYPAIDHNLFNPANAANLDNRAEVLGRYGISGRFLLYVGDSEWRKNLRRCLEALAGIEPAVKLVLVGKRALTDQVLHGWLDELGLRQRVVLTGFVPDAELPLFYGAALAFLFPSLYEGFGLPVAEAMACGCPVITSNLSSMPEVAGDAGLLVKPARMTEIQAAMHQLVTDEALRRRLQSAGIARAARFSWARTAAETIELLREVAVG